MLGLCVRLESKYIVVCVRGRHFSPREASDRRLLWGPWFVVVCVLHKGLARVVEAAGDVVGAWAAAVSSSASSSDATRRLDDGSSQVVVGGLHVEWRRGGVLAYREVWEVGGDNQNIMRCWRRALAVGVASRAAVAFDGGTSSRLPAAGSLLEWMDVEEAVDVDSADGGADEVFCLDDPADIGCRNSPNASLGDSNSGKDEARWVGCGSNVLALDKGHWELRRRMPATFSLAAEAGGLELAVLPPLADSEGLGAMRFSEGGGGGERRGGAAVASAASLSPSPSASAESSLERQSASSLAAAFDRSLSAFMAASSSPGASAGRASRRRSLRRRLSRRAASGLADGEGDVRPGDRFIRVY